MKYTCGTFSKRRAADILLIPFWEGKEAEIACSEKGLLKELSDVLSVKDFTGKLGTHYLFYPKKGKEKRFLLFGLGKKKEISTDKMRKAYAKAIKAARKNAVKKANLLLPEVAALFHEDLCRAVSEGVFLANYAFSHHKGLSLKKEPMHLIDSFAFLTKDPKKVVKKALDIAMGVHLTRNLVNTNADEINPQKLVDVAKFLAKKHKLVKTEIFDKKRIEKEKMGLLLAVNRGSFGDPNLIFIAYNGDPKSEDRVAFVGKGVTYDTGGLSLKPTSSMLDMKCDMGGAAVVLGLIEAAARMGLKKNILGVIPTTENGIDANSYKIGDVYTSYSGKTVEITNTDAEGRLILADAIAYTVKNFKPSAVIDLATLTGAIIVALGEEIAGLFTDNKVLGDVLQKASKMTGELIWPMPVHKEYKKLLRSDFADIKNAGDRSAGSITAALFLKEFSGEKMPWAHLDIAGISYLSKDTGYHPKNGTGQGVRLLIEFLEQMTKTSFKELKKNA